MVMGRAYRTAQGSIPPGSAGPDISAVLDKLSGFETKLDAIQDLIRLIRWGIPREPFWVMGDVLDEPADEDGLLAYDIAAGKTVKVYGLLLTGSEASGVHLADYDGTSIRRRYDLGGQGTLLIVLANPLVDGVPGGGDGNGLLVSKINAGGAGSRFQAGLLIDEV